jgi:hypothetical protein
MNPKNKPVSPPRSNRIMIAGNETMSYLALVILALGLLYLGTFEAGRKVLAAVFGVIFAIGFVAWIVFIEQTRQNEAKREEINKQIRLACGHKADSDIDDNCFFLYYENISSIYTFEECGGYNKTSQFIAPVWAQCLIDYANKRGPNVLVPTYWHGEVAVRSLR